MMMRLLLAAGMLFFQMQAPPDSPEEDKPLSCDNYFNTAPSHRCKCGRAMHADCSMPAPDVEMDKSCSTYCRKQNCHCVSKCTT